MKATKNIYYIYMLIIYVATYAEVMKRKSIHPKIDVISVVIYTCNLFIDK